jgi:hypothetical protein
MINNVTKNLIVGLILALVATATVGCSPAGLHGDNGGYVNEEADIHQSQGADFEPIKNEFSERMVINAPVEDVFPLLDPVRESDWIPGWEVDMIWSESGFAEEGAIFQTALHGDVKETWIISQYEPLEKIAFVRYNPSVITRLSIELTAGPGHTLLIWTQSQVGVDETGNNYLQTLNQEDFSANIKNSEVMLNYYLETGEMIDSETLNNHKTAPTHY